MLTRKQHELLLFIDGYLKQKGFSPSFEEMKDALALKSKSGIHRLISALEERGFLERRHNRARALEVRKLPDRPLSAALPDAEDEIANDRQDLVDLPLYGRIAAGEPIEALHDGAERLPVSASMLGSGTHYALTVAGDSMIDAGILDGDYAIIREGSRADDGDIVVALVDNAEATLKRLRRQNRMIALEPANAGYETRVLEPDRVQVQGKLIGLVRRY